MTDIDQMLREALPRIAAAPSQPPAAIAGTGSLAEVIRARVEAGDTGAVVAQSVAPGWGGVGLGGALASGAVIVGAGVVGTSLGLSGVLGGPATVVEPPASTVVVQAAAYDCVDGVVVGSFAADTRVLAVARSEDGAWVGVRSTSELLRTVWVPVSAVVADADLGSLPVGGECPTFTAMPLAPAPVESETPVEQPDPGAPPRPGPAPGPAPAPVPAPGDTSAPTLANASASPSPVYNADPLTISVSAADDVGVAGVTISLPGGGSAQMSKSGSVWTYVWNGTSTTTLGSISFTMVARDAAGNTSAPATATATHYTFG